MQKKQVSIHIGGIYGGTKPTVIYTLLGSCVAVCLYDPLKKIGAMNHILLPGRAAVNRFDARARFGINAMELLINKMLKLGAERRRLVAKVFGGAHMLPSIRQENGIGSKIAVFAVDFLKNETIPIVSKDLGGRRGRKVYFHTDSGDVYIKRIGLSQNFKLLAKEKKALPGIRREIKKPGQITIFR